MTDTATEEREVVTEKQFIDAAKAEFGSGLKKVAQKNYTRLTLGKKTVAYVTPGKKALVVHVPQGHGTYEKFKVESADGITEAVAAIAASQEAPAAEEAPAEEQAG